MGCQAESGELTMILETIAAGLGILTSICSAGYVVGMVRAELKGLRRDMNRAHQRIDNVEDKLFEVIT
jgi:hypothetical protein